MLATADFPALVAVIVTGLSLALSTLIVTLAPVVLASLMMSGLVVLPAIEASGTALPSGSRTAAFKIVIPPTGSVAEAGVMVTDTTRARRSPSAVDRTTLD